MCSIFQVMNGQEQEFDIGLSQRADKKKRIVFSAPERTRYVRVYPTRYVFVLLMRVGLLVCKSQVVHT